jgi:hypothetical protein
MKKLKLDLIDLRVESFVSSDRAEARGTVQANSDDSRQPATACDNPGACVANNTCAGAIGMCDPFSGLDC